MEMGFRCVCICTQLPLTGGAARSLFRYAATKLEGLREVVESLDSEELPQDEFQCLMDWLYVRCFPHMEDACFRYYEDRGPALCEVLSPSAVVAQERILLAFLARLEATQAA